MSYVKRQQSGGVDGDVTRAPFNQRDAGSSHHAALHLPLSPRPSGREQRQLAHEGDAAGEIGDEF